MWGLSGLSFRLLVAQSSPAASPWNRVWRNEPQSRKWATEPPTNAPHPFVIADELHAEAKRRGKDAAAQQAFEKAIDFNPARDQAEDLDKLAQRPPGQDRFTWPGIWRIGFDEAPTNPNDGAPDYFSGPSLIKRPRARHRGANGIARGILHAERMQFLSQHVERAIQKAWCRRYKPSKALENKRFPKLPRIETKLIPKEGPGKEERRIALRAELRQVVDSYRAFVGEPTYCPPEKTTRMLNKRRVGKPPIGEVAMNRAQIQKRYRDRKKLRVLSEHHKTWESAMMQSSELDI